MNLASMRCLHLMTQQKGHGIPASDPNKNLKNIINVFNKFAECHRNGWQWLERPGNVCKGPFNGSKWLEMAGKSWKCLEMACKLMEIALNILTWMEMDGNAEIHSQIN